jgi:hypothetical protein
MFVLDLLLLLDFMIYMLATLLGLWMKYLPTMRGTNSLLFVVHAGYVSFDCSLTFSFVFHVMVSTIGFYWIFLFQNYFKTLKYLLVCNNKNLAIFLLYILPH